MVNILVRTDHGGEHMIEFMVVTDSHWTVVGPEELRLVGFSQKNLNNPTTKMEHTTIVTGETILPHA